MYDLNNSCYRLEDKNKENMSYVILNMRIYLTF